jgi:flagellar motor switch protein FliM
MNVQSFRFKLKKVSEKEQRLLSALYDFLPKTGMRNEFASAIHDALNKHLGVETHYAVEAVSQASFGSYIEKLPDPVVLVVLGMAPREGKMIVQIDDHLTALFIEKLLGGTSEAVPQPRPLSDTEQGVLQYLVLQVLAHLHRLCGNDARLHFRFEKFVFTPRALKGVVSGDESAASLTVKITVGNHDGFVRLFVPSPLIEQQYLNVQMKGEVRQKEMEHLLGQLGEFSYVTVPLWADAGHSTLTAAELGNLEEGDVILFDSTQIALTDSMVTGKVILRTGEGRHGGFVSEITVSPKKVQCRIVDVHKGEDIFVK